MHLAIQPRCNPLFAMGSEGGEETAVLVGEVPFPPQIALTSNPLRLLGYGITEIEIHFLQIKLTAIGIYLDPEILTHLQRWKGKSGGDLSKEDEFFHDVIAAGVEKVVRVVVIKEIKGAQYGLQLETAVRDRLADEDKYEEEEEEALEKVAQFFQSKYLKRDSFFTFHFPSTTATATTPSLEIALTEEGKEESRIQVENNNVAEAIQKWYLGGSRAISDATISSLADHLAVELSK